MVRKIKLAPLALAIMISTSVVTEVDAVNSVGSYNVTDTNAYFSDTGSSPYKSEIEFLRALGITSGVGNNKFNPNAYITEGDFLVMIARSLGNNNVDRVLSANASYHDKLINLSKVIWSMGYVDYSYTISNVLSADSAGKMAFSLGDFPIYGDNIYKGSIEKSETAGYDQLVRLGIISKELEPKQEITRELAAHILYTVMFTGLQVETPEVFSKYNIQIERSDFDTTLLLNELNKIPDEVKKYFEDGSWKIVIGTSYINHWSYENGMIANGLCDYAGSTIYLANLGSLIHEVGHMLNSKLNFPNEIDRLFNAEKNQLSQITGWYCKTNSSEYFAELFEYYIDADASPDRIEKLEKLKSVAPESYAYMVKLENNGWKA